MTEPCEFLPWDTEFFGVRVARVCGGRLTPDRARDVLDWCDQRRISCLYFLADAGHTETVASAEACGFGLKDVRLTCRWRKAQLPEPAALPAGFVVRPACPSDLATLETIAGASHTDSRFYFDQRFAREAVGRLYRTWLRQSVGGGADACLVLEGPGGPGGYITCHLDPPSGEGSIGLGGLASDLRGRGLGQGLYREALRWFGQHRVESVRYVTQGRNIQAQRVIQRLGFLTETVQLWYHRWFD